MVTLKEQDKQDGAAEEEARVEAIRALCQGAAFLQLPSQAVPRSALDAFGVDEELFISLVRRSLELLVNGPHKEAIECALGRYSGHDTLTKRRNHFLESRDISYRTLIRHEQEGAAALASLMMKIKDEAGSSPASPVNLQNLEGRVADLETLVMGLAGLSNRLLNLLEESKPIDAQALRDGMLYGAADDEHAIQILADAEQRVCDRAFRFAMRLREGQS